MPSADSKKSTSSLEESGELVTPLEDEDEFFESPYGKHISTNEYSITNSVFEKGDLVTILHNGDVIHYNFKPRKGSGKKENGDSV